MFLPAGPCGRGDYAARLAMLLLFWCMVLFYSAAARKEERGLQTADGQVYSEVPLRVRQERRMTP